MLILAIDLVNIMYKSIYDSWTREDKRYIIEDNERLRRCIDALNRKLSIMDNQLADIDEQRESLNNLKSMYESLKLSDDTNLALDAYVQYKKDCEAQLKELNEQLNDNSIVDKCKRITILSNVLLIILLGGIIFVLSAQKNSYADDIDIMNSSIEKLNKDNQKLQSDYNEVSISNSQLTAAVNNYKNKIDDLQTSLSECEANLKSNGKANTKSKPKKDKVFVRYE